MFFFLFTLTLLGVANANFFCEWCTEVISDIEKFGGTVCTGVSKKTDYLLTNDTESGSSKNKKAKELNIPVITEEDFLKLIKKEK